MAPPGNQAVNGENKHQPDVSEETGLLDSIINYQLIFHPYFFTLSSSVPKKSTTSLLLFSRIMPSSF